MANLDPSVTGFVVALGIGLLIGAERERRKGEGTTRSASGIRTFVVATLMGAASFRGSCWSSPRHGSATL